VRSGEAAAVTGNEGVASLEIATRCLETSAKQVAAPSARKGPRRVAG
jgi:UDP-N-acetylglucosamine 3-dehydrogenase